MHYRTAMKPLGTLALTLAALLGFAGTANAAPATTGYIQMWHQRHDGFHWTTTDGQNRSMVPIRRVLPMCGHSAACRTNVHTYYRSLHSDWRSFNAELWTAAASLPACDDSGADCVAPSFGGVTRVRIDGEDYYAQSTTKPTA